MPSPPVLYKKKKKNTESKQPRWALLKRNFSWYLCTSLPGGAQLMGNEFNEGEIQRIAAGLQPPASRSLSPRVALVHR